MIATNTLVTIVVIALVAAVAVLATVILRRRRRHIWSEFAAEHGLRFVDADPPFVDGRVDGYPFRLEAARAGSDSGELGVEKIRMSLSLEGSLPRTLRMRGEPDDVIGDLARRADENAVETGDADVDAHALVEEGDDELRAYLTPERKRTLLKLVEPERGCGGISNGELWIEDRTLVSDPEILRRHLQLLREAAAGLDAGRRGEG